MLPEVPTHAVTRLKYRVWILLDCLTLTQQPKAQLSEPQLHLPRLSEAWHLQLVFWWFKERPKPNWWRDLPA